MEPPADFVGDFMSDAFTGGQSAGYDAVWACHVLEHQVDPGAFLRKARSFLKPGGVLAITVPPMKHQIVSGHVTLWNAGLLIYQLILAGFDCRNARVGTYGYNISVIVENVEAVLPVLANDEGDIEKLAPFFPGVVRAGFDGRLPDIRWIDPMDRPPRHIAIVGLGPSAEAYMDHVKRHGSRHAFCDQVWGINAIGSVLDVDLVVHMDDVRVQEIRAAAKPKSNIANMVRWLKNSRVPVLTSCAHPDYPALVEFPFEAVVNQLGRVYFNNTGAYAVAYAIYLGAEKISLFGCDYTYPDAHKAEKGRACMEFWLGVAFARGIEIALPQNTSLLDEIVEDSAEDVYAYGYDCVKIAYADDNGRMKFTMTPREKLPTAEQIEAAYDHGRPPHEQHGRMAAE